MPIVQALQAFAAGVSVLMSPVNVQTDVPPGPQGRAVATANLVGGILGYTRWPGDSGPVQLCVVGRSALSSQLSNRALVGNRPMTVRRLEAAQTSFAGCHAIFVAQAGLPEQRRIVRLVTGQAIVTMDDGTDGCAVGLMVCIRPAANGGMTFDLDIDAVSRSTVQIDPRVLSLGRRSPPQ